MSHKLNVLFENQTKNIIMFYLITLFTNAILESISRNELYGFHKLYNTDE